jgi:hypothetical protein
MLLPGSWSEAMKRRDFAAIADWFIWYFFWGGVIGLVAAGLAAFVEEYAKGIFWSAAGSGLRIFVLSVLFASASAVSGWMLGLLFGIPRSLARGTAAPNTPPAASASATGPTANAASSSATSATAAASSSRVNTNLEDISDWLTKTIVGVGLTQLYQVPHYLWHVAERLNEQGFNWPQHGQLLALALFLYFAPGGFWLGYVGTRTILTKLFDSIDGVDQELLDVASQPNNLLLSGTGQGFTTAPDPRVANADRAVLAKTLQDLTTPVEIAAWGAAQARSGNLTAAQTALSDAVRGDPQNVNFKELAAIVHSALGQHDEANRLLDDLPMIDITVFNALYEPPPGGFTRAIAVGERLLTRPNQDRNANLHVWMACAYSQRYRYERDTNHTTAAVLDPIKANVSREVQAALNANPNTRELLRSLWRPAAGSTENDLAAFAPDDADLTALLGGP